MMAGFGLIWILVLAALAYAVFAVMKRPSGGGPRHPPLKSDDAEEILRQRFARGEIDRDEYENRPGELRR